MKFLKRLVLIILFIGGAACNYETVSADEKPDDLSQSNASLDSDLTSDELFEAKSLFNLTKAAPPVPGETDILTNIFRNPVGTGPALLSEKILQITPPRPDQKGAIWSKRRLDLKQDFKLVSYIYLGNSGYDAADGVTFTLQNDPRMATNDRVVIGGSGMALGVYSESLGGPYVQNALSIEFDTFFNAEPHAGMDYEIRELGEIGHVAFVKPKANNNNFHGEHSGAIVPNELLSNGTWKELTISWKAQSQVLTYNVKGWGSASYHVRNLNEEFGGDRVYWGLTASTGMYYQENIIAISGLPQKINHLAKVENLTQGSQPAVKITANRGDKVKLSSEVDTFGSFDLTMLEGPQVTVGKLNGLKPDLETVKINGVSINAKEVSFINNQLIIREEGLGALGLKPFGMSLSFEGEVVEELGNVTLSSKVTLGDQMDQEFSISNPIEIDVPKVTTGEVVIKYLDEWNQPLAKEKTITGQIGTTYEETALKINGFELKETIGQTSGKFTEKGQTLIFKYQAMAFVLEQGVFDKEQQSLDGGFVNNNDVLAYKLSLKSVFEEEVPVVYYQELTVTQKVDPNLTAITEITLTDNQGNLIGTGQYQEQENSIIATLTEKYLARNENIYLSFKGRVKNDVMAETKLTVSGTVVGSYSNNLIIKPTTSNEVSSTVLGELRFVSAPVTIDFGELSISHFRKEVGVPKEAIDQPLLVEDTRKKRSPWYLTAEISRPMTNGTDQREDALRYYYKGEPLILKPSPQVIYQNNGEDTKFDYNITDDWQAEAKTTGLKFKINSNQAPISSDSYKGSVKWVLRNTID